jgi:hypothetical protein
MQDEHRKNHTYIPVRLRFFLAGWLNHVFTYDCQSFLKWPFGTTLLCFTILQQQLLLPNRYCNRKRRSGRKREREEWDYNSLRLCPQELQPPTAANDHNPTVQNPRSGLGLGLGLGLSTITNVRRAGMPVPPGCEFIIHVGTYPSL